MVSSLAYFKFKMKVTLRSSKFWFWIFTAAVLYILVIFVHHDVKRDAIQQSQGVSKIESKPTTPHVAHIGLTAAIPRTVTSKSETNSFNAKEIKLLERGFKNQTDPRLLLWLRTHWINTPSHKPLNLPEPQLKDNSQHEQTLFLDKFMGRKTNGFFIECGYKNEESSTLFFERYRNWTGLLVEPNPNDYKELLLKQRHSYSIKACLNTKNITGRYEFIADFGRGGLVHEMMESHKKALQYPKVYIKVQCFTLWSIMKAIGKKHVDLFSLDVGGAEVGILKTIPFSELDIDIFLIEYLVPGSPFLTQNKIKEMQSFLHDHGYKLAKTMTLDLLFVKKLKQYK